MNHSKIDTIYLDLDDTIVDWTGAVVRHFNSDASVSEVTEYHSKLLEVCGCTNNELYDLMCSAYFWTDLRITALGNKLLCACEAALLDWTIVTCVPSIRKDIRRSKAELAQRVAASSKVQWLQDHNLEDRFFVGIEKWRLAAPGKLLIDDNPARVEKFIAHGGQGIIVPQPWNTETRCPIEQLKALLHPPKNSDGARPSRGSVDDLVNYTLRTQ